MSPERDSTSFRPFIPFVLMIVLLTLLTGMVVAAPTAQAADAQLLVSQRSDGPWQPHLSVPLFDGAGAVVPLDRATSRFYVKNDSRDVARTSVSWTVSGADDELARSLRFSAVVGGSTTEPSGECPQVTGPSIPPGGVQRIDVEMRVADASAGETMGQTADVNLELRLEQVAGDRTRDLCSTTSPPDSCLDVVGDGCSGTVQGTGSPAPAPSGPSAGSVPSGAQVPTVVDAGAAGQAGSPPPALVREAGRVVGIALAAFLLGVLLLAASRRRPATQTAGRANENLF